MVPFSEIVFPFSEVFSCTESFRARIVDFPAPEAEDTVGDDCAGTVVIDVVTGAALNGPRLRAVLTAPADEDDARVAVRAFIRAVATGLAVAFDTTALTDSIALGRVVANFPAPFTLARGFGGEGEAVPVPIFFWAVFQAGGRAGMGGRVSSCTKSISGCQGLIT